MIFNKYKKNRKKSNTFYVHKLGTNFQQAKVDVMPRVSIFLGSFSMNP